MEINFSVHKDKYITKCPFCKKMVGSKSCWDCKYFVKEKSYIGIDDGGEGVVICSKTT